MKTHITVYFGTALVAMFLVPIISRLAKKYQLVDTPGPRKVHHIPVPRIGGVVFIVSTLALVLPLFFLNNEIGRSFRESKTEFIVLLAGASFIFAVGLIDDLRTVRPNIKLLCIVGASLAVCASGATIRSISVGPWFELEFGWLAWPLAVIWITTITIGMNFIDGLDGLAGGIAAIVCGTILFLALWTSQTAIAVLMLALLGSVTGFLFFNFYPAKIFMGDCGSMFLGFMIGAGSMVCQTKTSTLVGLALPFLVMGLPILDTGFVIISRRVIERRSIFAPDRSHLHHRLLDLGLNHRTAVIVLYALTAIIASVGVFILTVEGRWSPGLLTGGILLLFTMFACLHSGRYRKILMVLKRNWELSREARKEKHNFESAQLRMCESGSLSSWWKTVCLMGKQMNFQSIELWNIQNGNYVNTFVWNASEDKFSNVNTTKLCFPLQANGTTGWEIRASICTDNYLELSGRKAMLLARLIDEFPPPEQDEDHAADMDSSSYDRQLESLANSKRSKMLEYVPAPVSIMKIPVVPFKSYDQVLECIENIVESKLKSLCFAINPIKIYHAWQNPELLNILRQTDIVVCDGVGVSMASKILYGQSIKRCTGCDLFFKLLSIASRKEWSVYLLGASSKSNTNARLELQKKYPGLKVVGWQDGYFQDSSAVIKQINASGANLLFVAMGSPKQEYWIWHHWQEINVNFCMGVGGSFDIAAGSLKRAPKIFRVTGTEFLFRLIMEPYKRWQKQKVLVPYFLRVVEKKLVDLTMSDEEQKN